MKKQEPIRTCIVTKETHPKRNLIRVVVNQNKEVNVDLTGKLAGRGAYLKLDEAVIKRAQKLRLLDQKLGVKVSDEIYERLLALIHE